MTTISNTTSTLANFNTTGTLTHFASSMPIEIKVAAVLAAYPVGTATTLTVAAKLFPKIGLNVPSALGISLLNTFCVSQMGGMSKVTLIPFFLITPLFIAAYCDTAGHCSFKKLAPALFTANLIGGATLFLTIATIAPPPQS